MSRGTLVSYQDHGGNTNIHSLTPVTLRQPMGQRTTNAAEISKQSYGVNTCLGTTCHGSV